MSNVVDYEVQVMGLQLDGHDLIKFAHDTGSANRLYQLYVTKYPSHVVELRVVERRVLRKSVVKEVVK